jgi:hypothetical protein
MRDSLLSARRCDGVGGRHSARGNTAGATHFKARVMRAEDSTGKTRSMGEGDLGGTARGTRSEGCLRRARE